MPRGGVPGGHVGHAVPGDTPSPRTSAGKPNSAGIRLMATLSSGSWASQNDWVWATWKSTARWRDVSWPVPLCSGTLPTRRRPTCSALIRMVMRTLLDLKLLLPLLERCIILYALVLSSHFSAITYESSSFHFWDVIYKNGSIFIHSKLFSSFNFDFSQNKYHLEKMIFLKLSNFFQKVGGGANAVFRSKIEPQIMAKPPVTFFFCTVSHLTVSITWISFLIFLLRKQEYNWSKYCMCQKLLREKLKYFSEGPKILWVLFIKF